MPAASLSKRERAVLGLLLRHHLRRPTSARAA
jgi:hypothetical protein